MKKSITNRGFHVMEFVDLYGEKCSIQKSSYASDNAIWFGLNEVGGVVSDEDGKISKYEKPDNVDLFGRMHLTQAQVKELLPILTHFAETGELPK